MKQIYLSILFLLVITAVSAQNVGIGTASPAYKLDVAGDVNLTGKLRLSGLATANKVLKTDASGNPVWGDDNNTTYTAGTGISISSGVITNTVAIPSNNVTGSGVATRVAFWSGTNTLSSNANLYWDNTNSRLGVGTASPQSPLHVNGRVETSRLGTVGTYDSYQVQGIWSIGRGYNIDATLNDFGNQYGMVYAHTNAGTSTAKLPIAGWGHQILFASNGTRNAAISLTSGHGYFAGNMGLGTTAPAQKLHVEGNARITALANASGSIVKSNASGDLSVTALTGNANHVLNGAGNFVDAATLAVTGDNLGNHTATTHLNMSDFQLQNVNAIQGKDWDDNTGGSNNTYRLLYRDGAHMFYNGGVVVGAYSNGTWTGGVPSGNLIVSGAVGIATISPAEKLDVTGNVKASGIVYWGNGLVRTESRNDAGLQGNAGARSGFFETSAPSPAANWPTGASSWWHLLDIRHSNNSNNYAMQFSGSFFDQDLYYRKTNGSANTAWSKVATTSNFKAYGASATRTLINSSTYTDVGGLSITFTLTGSSIVLINTSGALETTAGTDGASGARVAVYNGTTMVTEQTVDIVNNYYYSQNINPWGISTYQTLSAGTYTIKVKALKYVGSNFYAGGSYTSLTNEGTMTVLIIPQ
jgi:hypothetical protein